MATYKATGIERRRQTLNRLNVLLIVYAFPPAGGVGVLRAASLARYFSGEGIRLDVLTTRNPSSVGYDPSLLGDIPPDVTIHRTITFDLPFGIKKRLKRFLTGGRPAAAVADGKSPSSKPSFLKRAFQDVFVPDPQVTWLPVLARAARRIVRRRNIDLVLITAAPFSNLLVAKRLRAEFPHLPIVLDFRDEWLGSCFDINTFQFSRTDRARDFAVKAEAMAIKAATAVVGVTQAARRAIRERYPQEAESKFLYIPNGFDATRLKRSSVPPSKGLSGKIVITYVGSVYGSTDPTLFVEALKSIPDAVKSRLSIRFVGHIEEFGYRESLCQLGEMVELKGYKPQREALAAMDETDYALLIFHDHLNIPAKFYDYIGAGKPVLGCIHPESDMRGLIEELGAGWWADSRDVGAMRQLLLDAVARSTGLTTEFRPDCEKIAQFERKVVAQRYASLLRSIAASPNEYDKGEAHEEEVLVEQ